MNRSVDHECLQTLQMLHRQVTAEVARLMEGFYSNLEDGLFELAYRDSDSTYQGYCFNLMRELRFRRQLLMETFTRRMHDGAAAWMEDVDLAGDDTELNAIALAMSRKCSAHFGTLLRSIIDRATDMTGRPLDLASLPIGPYQVARHFVQSCHLIEFDKASIEVVQELFLRFVLDRLGTAYGQCNQVLNTPLAGTLDRQLASA